MRPIVKSAATSLVTPFTPFILSHHYFSAEIEEFGLSWLNPRSSNLRRDKFAFSSGDVVYCRDDELEQFCNEVLPFIDQPFIFLTGTGTEGGLPDNQWAAQILKSTFLVKWFAHNQTQTHLDVSVFPQGVELRRAPQILLASVLFRWLSKKIGEPQVSYATVHPHLISPAREIRERLVPLMGSPKKYFAYLRDIARHQFVISPPGDRDDTYRHWECILLGTFPVSTIDGNYRELFQDNMVYVQDLNFAATQKIRPPKSRPDSLRVRVDFWRAIVEREIELHETASQR